MRARHEAKWSHEEARVKGRRQSNRWWIMLLGFALIVVLAALGYTRFWNFETVSYELRQCTQPLTAESSWAEVQDAACDPVPAGSNQLAVTIEREVAEPDTVEGSTYFFEMMPVNSPAPALRAELERPARTVVVAEPENEQIRRAMSGDASGTRWSASIGSRGPTAYWVLVTP